MHFTNDAHRFPHCKKKETKLHKNFVQLMTVCKKKLSIKNRFDKNKYKNTIKTTAKSRLFNNLSII